MPRNIIIRRKIFGLTTSVQCTTCHSGSIQVETLPDNVSHNTIHSYNSHSDCIIDPKPQ